MILTLDVGNSQIHGGLFMDDKLLFQFRKSSKQGNSSDEIGLFLRSVLAEKDVKPDQVKHVAFCSVVPDLIHSIGSATVKYFGSSPFLLRPGVKTGLKIRYRNPVEVGADRIANAIGALKMFPGKDLILVDLGTANTFCAISKEREFLGGSIMPGLRLSMEALERETAQLPAVEIRQADVALGRSTVEGIQSGLYFGTLDAIRGFIGRFQNEAFGGRKAHVVGTGGFSRIFDSSGAFDAHVSELIHIGLIEALRMNKEGTQS
jgi:type III pantothenate kinase